MRQAIFAITLCTAVGACTFPSSLQAQKAPGSPWIVDDIGKGFLEAQKSGKPLLVVFR